VFRHNLVLKLLYSFALDAGLDSRKELVGYKLNAKDRIGDLCLPFADHGRELLVDVTCWNPLYAPRINISSAIPHHTAKLAHKDKLTKRDLDDQQMIDTVFGRIKFMPFACDTFGGWTHRANELIHRIAEEYSIKRSRKLSSCIHLIKSRISFAITHGSAVCLLIRNIDARSDLEDTKTLFEEGFTDFPNVTDCSDFSDGEDGYFAESDFDYVP
jgi:hypothetical protein